MEDVLYAVVGGGLVVTCLIVLGAAIGWLTDRWVRR
jgi:F0F1-type ATP synthase assembly protein I